MMVGYMDHLMVQVKERIHHGRDPAVLLGVTPIEFNVLAVALR
jgi:hypothetical protein